MKLNMGSRNVNAQHEKAENRTTGAVDYRNKSKSEVAPKYMDEEGSCSMSSSSSTLSDEFFQIDVSNLSKQHTSHGGIPRNNSSRPPLPSGSGHFGTAGTKQAPPIQSMGRLQVPDPNRIPSSIFARSKSASPMEWSATSNDSLFSIHMGKSGELTSIYSSQSDGDQPKSSHLPPPSKGVGRQASFHQIDKSEVADTESMKNLVRKPFTADGIPHSDSASVFSDGGSVASYRSFAFPILTAQGKNEVVEEPKRLSSVKEQPQHKMLQPESPDEDRGSKVQYPKAGEAAARCRWFKCPTCSFCCSCSFQCRWSCSSRSSCSFCGSRSSCNPCSSCSSCNPCISCSSWNPCISCSPCNPCSSCSSCNSCSSCTCCSCFRRSCTCRSCFKRKH